MPQPDLFANWLYELAPKVRVNGVGPCGMASDLRAHRRSRQSETLDNVVFDAGENCRHFTAAIFPATGGFYGAVCDVDIAVQ